MLNEISGVLEKERIGSLGKERRVRLRPGEIADNESLWAAMGSKKHDMSITTNCDIEKHAHRMATWL